MRRFILLVSAIALTVVGLVAPATAVTGATVNAPAEVAAGQTVAITVTPDSPAEFGAQIYGPTAGGGNDQLAADFEVRDFYTFEISVPNVGPNEYYVDFGDHLEPFTIIGLDSSPEPVATSLTISGSTSTYAGETVMLSVDFSANGISPVGTYDLQANTGSGWTQIANSDGSTSHAVAPSVETSYRAVFAGNDEFKASESLTHTITILPPRVDAVVSLTPSADEVYNGESATVKVSWSNVNGQAQNGEVQIEQKDPYSPDFYVITGGTVTDGTAEFTVNPIEKTEFRVITPATETTNGAVSAPVTITAVPRPDEAVVSLEGPVSIHAGKAATLTAKWANGEGAKQTGTATIQSTSAATDFVWADLVDVDIKDGVGEAEVVTEPETYYRLVTPQTNNTQPGISVPIEVLVDKTYPVEITLSGPEKVDAGKTANLTVKAVDEQGNLITGSATLQSQPVGTTGWTDVSALTLTNGEATYDVVVNADTRYRVVTPETETADAGVSNEIVVDTDVVLLKSTLALSGPDSVTAGQSATFDVKWEDEDGDPVTGTAILQGRLAPAESGFFALLVADWTDIKTVNVVNGVATTDVVVDEDSQYRLVAAQTATLEAAESDPITVKAEVDETLLDSTLTLSGPEKVEVGKTATFKVEWVDENGAGVNGTVDLQGRLAPAESASISALALAPDWASVSTVQVVNGVGQVNVQVTANSQFRLVSAQTATLAAQQSATFTVLAIPAGPVDPGTGPGTPGGVTPGGVVPGTPTGPVAAGDTAAADGDNLPGTGSGSPLWMLLAGLLVVGIGARVLQRRNA